MLRKRNLVCLEEWRELIKFANNIYNKFIFMSRSLLFMYHLLNFKFILYIYGFLNNFFFLIKLWRGEGVKLRA